MARQFEVRSPPMNHRSRLVEARARHPSSAMWSSGSSYRRRRGTRPVWLHVAILVAVGGSIGGLAAVAVDDPVEVRVAGIEEAQLLSKSDVEQLSIEVKTSGMGASDVVVQMNGVAVDMKRVDGALVARPAALVRDGLNEVDVRVHGRFVFDDVVVTRRFTAVLTAPVLDVTREILRPPAGEPLVVRGLVDDAVALEVDGRPVAIDGGGFSAEVPGGTPSVVVRATHENGNVTERVIQVVDVATPVEHAETRAVHVSARAWADPAIHDAIVAMIREGRINAVQLDIKDESGEVGYLSAVPLANTAGAARPHYDPQAAIAELHGMGVRVIGRIVCFLDPVVAGWAWDGGRGDMVVQSAGAAGPLDNNYGEAAFTSFASPDVQRYLIDLSTEAAGYGFDEILYDYVRRPEGPMDSMSIPGLVRPPEVEIARFVRDTRIALEPFDVDLGLSVFGISASRPDQIAQDIRLLAPQVDYISPMVYPSHWGDGEYGVDDPDRQPGDIVDRSLADFEQVAGGSGAAIVPWLQAFSANGVQYGPAEIQAQIAAAMATGSSGFLLWNSGSLYDSGALVPAP